MVRSALSKVVWMARATTVVVGLAIMLGLIFGVATSAFGANGGNFILGSLNNTATDLAIKSATHQWNWRGREIGGPGLHQCDAYAVCALSGSRRDIIFCHRYSTYSSHILWRGLEGRAEHGLPGLGPVYGRGDRAVGRRPRRATLGVLERGTLRLDLHHAHRDYPRVVRLGLPRTAVGGDRRGLPAHRLRAGLRGDRGGDGVRGHRSGAHVLGLRGSRSSGRPHRLSSGVTPDTIGLGTN